MRGEEVIDAAPQPGHPVRELVGERPLPRIERTGPVGEGAIQSSAPLRLEPDAEGRLPGVRRLSQSSMPLVGDDGTAISRAGILPAR